MDTIKKLLLSSCIALAFTAPSYAADAEPLQVEAEEEKSSFFPGTFSGSATFASDYRFRGLSQTDESAAVQGVIEWALDLNDNFSVSVGAFGSNINFTPTIDPIDATPEVEDDGSIEIDYYGSVSYSFGDASVSVGGIYYHYPDATNSLNQDFFEVTAAFGYEISDDFSVSLDYAFSPEFFGDTGEAHYIRGSGEYALSFIPGPFPVSLAAGVGFQELEGDGDYIHWDVGLTVAITDNLSITGQYVDTDTSPLVFEARDIADSTFVGSVSVSF